MRRRVGLFLMVSLVLPLVVAASASAQGSTLRLSPNPASPGDVVTATATSGYSAGAGISGVSIRLSTRSGQVLRATSPDGAGGFSASFPLPALSPGWYLILATQTTANGRQRAFTPGRTRLLVRAAPAGADAAPAGGQGGLTPPLALSAGVLALILLAAGATLAARRRWTPNRPHLGS